MTSTTPPPHTIIAIGRTLTTNAFVEKVATNVRTCSSTGKQIDIAYHTFGNPADPMIVLISGLNAQCVVNYCSATCTWLAQQGFYAVRFDNRDVGLSTKFDDVPQRLSMPMFMLPSWMAYGEIQPYSLDDMADDASAMIKFLNVERGVPENTKTHIIGISMGGMITQCVGLRTPHLVASMTLVMTHSGNQSIASPSLSTRIGFLYKPKSNSIEHFAEFRKWWVMNYLAGHEITDFTLLDIIQKEFVRSTYVAGATRQMAAIQRTASRDEQLKKQFGASPADNSEISVHIVHGARDRLVPVANAYHMAKLMPAAKLSVFPTMGHYLEPDNIQNVYDSIIEFIRRK